MTRSKIATGIAALLLAGVGAFASTATFAPNTYYFKPTISTCVSTVVNFDCIVHPDEGCVGPEGQPSAAKQLYLTDDCDQPLKRS